MNNLEELFQRFIENMTVEKDIAKNTIDNYTCDFKIFKLFLSAQGIPLSIDKIDKHILKQFFHYLKFKKNYATATMRRKIHTLSSFFKYLYEDDIILNNPMKSIKAPKKPKELPIFISEEDIKTILTSIDRIGGNFILRDKCFFLLLFLTGVRKSELINLRWKHIDFSSKTITVFKGKGNKSRLIPLVQPLSTYLKLLQQENKSDIHDYVLYSITYNKMSPTSASLLFRRYIKKNSLTDKGYTIHKCRHSFATNLARNGIDVIEIAEILGHEDINTSKIYIHLANEKITEKISNIEYVTSIKTFMK